MAEVTITELSSISPSSVNPAVDVIPMVSISGNTTDKVTLNDLKTSMNIQGQNLSAVSEDIIPVFDGVYDIGSTEKKFYDGYFTGKVQIGTKSIQDDIGDIVIDTNLVVQNITSSDIADFGSITIENNIISINPLDPGYGPQELILSNNTTVQGDINVIGDILQNGQPFSSSVISSGSATKSTVRINNNNTILQPYSGILSGCNNTIIKNPYGPQQDAYSIILGGISNCIKNTHSFIGGGCNNEIGGQYNVILGGINNYTSTFAATVGGGSQNYSTGGNYNFVGGGFNNTVQSQYAATSSSIGGGQSNCVSRGFSIIGGGCFNRSSGTYRPTAIGGGRFNCTAGDNSVIGGGYRSRTNGQFASVFGGCYNTSSGNYSSILGGKLNSIPTNCCFTTIVGSNITADRICTTFVNNLSIKNIPTSSAGLPSGAVWRCTTDDTLRIVP